MILRTFLILLLLLLVNCAKLGNIPVVNKLTGTEEESPTKNQELFLIAAGYRLNNPASSPTNSMPALKKEEPLALEVTQPLPAETLEGTANSTGTTQTGEESQNSNTIPVTETTAEE